MSKDIQPLLDDWPCKPGQLCVRKIKGNDGRAKVQLRIEMGILQMNVTGRPDGERPEGYESLLHYYKAQAEERGPEDFVLDSESCMALQMEALQYYHRRISFLEIGEYRNAKKDAERNLKLFDFVKEYAEEEEDRLAFEHYRPFVIGHRVRAEVLMYLEREAYDMALSKIDTGIDELQTFFKEFDRHDLIEESEEIAFLQEWADEIRRDRPKTLSQNLRDQIREAVGLEDFERAAELRDRLLSLKEKTEI
jgi:hypothetical protein